MPELPEVESGRKVAARVAEGRRIVKTKCAHDRIVFDGVTPQRMARALKGARVLAVHRKGKQLWFELDRSPHPLFHYGMTGAFRVKGDRPLKLASSPNRRRDDQWPPRFTKIHLTFDDGGELVMVNKRRLGRIRLRQNPLEEPPISGLGFDPLDEFPSPKRFRELIAGRSGILKGLLLDQSFAAGVGNWIADEVLYQAKLDPSRRADSLTEAEVGRLRSKLGSVIRKAVAVDAVKEKFPRTWLFHHRWGRDETAQTARGEEIRFLRLAGRTTAWVPGVQT